MQIVIVIPARIGSTRFPEKPLADIAGKSLIQRMWDIASAVDGVDGVFVATDAEKIATHVESFGGRAIMTPSECANGTERAYAAVQQLENPPEIIINLQGDAVLTPPYVIQPLVDAMRADASINFGTVAARLDKPTYDKMVAAKQAGEVGGTTVTFDKNHNALYFSKGVIPFMRYPVEPLPVFKHIGLYGYRFGTLEQYLSLPMGPLEEAESLEQLRALEHGIPIKVVEVDYKGRTPWAVDSPEDAKRVEEIIAAEGELL